MGVFNRLKSIFGHDLSQADIDFIDSHLEYYGRFLFFQMGKIDQRHSLAVARDILAEVGSQPGLDLNTLVKAALLHDIGKVDGELNLINRIIAGILRRICPECLKRWGIRRRSGPFKLRYAFYVDMVHPARGSWMAHILGIDEQVVDLIRRHHDPPAKEQKAELTWLQLVDNRH